MRRAILAILFVLTATTATSWAALKPQPPRQVVALDGAWQVEQGGMENPPEQFTHTVAVPGLVDMAQPAFREVGKKSDLRQAFWYRRTFTLASSVPEIAVLKIHKARYGTKVFLNGKLVGEHLPCFTPAYMNVRPYLRTDAKPNELVIRVGANRESIPQDMPTGWDFEKYLYIPGIYDSVELILTGTPYLVNVQAAPDLAKSEVRVVAELEASQPGPTAVLAEVAEAASGKVVGTRKIDAAMAAKGATKLDFTIPIPNCRLWSPDDPFLYEIRLASAGDAATTRFGMRSFAFDAQNKRALLNGKPYYMRGTNVTLYRFFEDADRGDKPWRAEWVRRLHRQYKSMHWSSIRYCIGLAPEFWYDIADEEGFLIQDEFPIWLLDKAPTENPKTEKIIPEYIEWMRERWNHPCVVIWDGQNESRTDQTGKAIQAVRHLDLSNRPWENGWAEPQSPADFVESHPYLFNRGWDTGKNLFHLKELEAKSGVPALQQAQRKLAVPIVINEYDWLWLNRDGSPTCLTAKIYEGLLGKNATVAQRRHFRARAVAALTEYWRCHREAAGVLHFCGLGYSRSGDKPRPEGGATCDDFIDLEKLAFEPEFAEYVREAFNPVGLLLDFWAEEVPAKHERQLKVFVINDLEAPWSGQVRLRMLRGDREASVQTQPCTVPSCGRQILDFRATFPAEPGEYTLSAEITDREGKPVRSLRDVKVR